MKRIKKFVKENPETVALCVIGAIAGSIIGSQRADILKLRKDLIRETTFVHDFLGPMQDGLAAKLDSTGEKLVFFELAKR